MKLFLDDLFLDNLIVRRREENKTPTFFKEKGYKAMDKVVETLFRDGEPPTKGLRQEELLFQVLSEKFFWISEKHEHFDRTFDIDRILRGNVALPFSNEIFIASVTFFNPFPANAFENFLVRTKRFSGRKVFICCHPNLDINPQGAAVVDGALKALLFLKPYTEWKIASVHVREEFFFTLQTEAEVRAARREGEIVIGRVNENDKDCSGAIINSRILENGRRLGNITADGEDLFFGAFSMVGRDQAARDEAFDSLQVGDEVIFDIQQGASIDETGKKRLAVARNIRRTGRKFDLKTGNILS